MDLINFSKITPKWMDKSFFEKVVKHMEKDQNAQVQQFSVTPGAKPGDHFASSIFRVSITFHSKFTENTSKLISVIVKTQIIQPLETLADFLHESPLFKNEMEMYGKILPAVQSLWDSIGEKDILFPKLIYQSTEPTPVIIFEDVGVNGFQVIPEPPKDFEVTKKIFRRLAKFHAATFYLHHEQKLDYNNFNTSLYQNIPSVDMICVKGLDAFIEVAKEKEDYHKFIPNLESFQKEFLGKALKTYTPNPEGFGYNVLNHADFHVKNLLFKKNIEGGIEDFYFVDYQICIFATPAIDLIYGLYYFMTTENRQKYRDEVILIYHQQFVESLTKFGFNGTIPSLMDLQVELLRNGNLEVLIAICFSVFLHFDFAKLTPEEMDLGEGTAKAKRRIYREVPEFMEGILKELPRFLYNGFI